LFDTVYIWVQLKGNDVSRMLILVWILNSLNYDIILAKYVLQEEEENNSHKSIS